MDPSDLNRRDFQKLALAALGGAALGASLPATTFGADVNPLLEEPHVCRGLNTCKGKGPGKDNACAGTGACATAVAHSCNGENACKGQGGCGENPGENACKGKGGCHVPLHDSIWPKTRQRFEELMAGAGKKVGPAPPKKS